MPRTRTRTRTRSIMAPSPTAPPLHLRVLESSRVAPPRGSAPADASLPLSFFDVTWLRMNPVERVFFYQFPHPTSHFLRSALPVLKSSLSLTLQHFYPLAGAIGLVPGSDDRHEIRYVDGDSVAFAVAECEDEDFDELSGSRPRDATRLLRLVPPLPRSADAQPLMTVQATVFPNHGVAVGVTLHHAACDGSSSTHFLSSWAACCRSGGSVPVLSRPPVFDRTLISDPLGLYSVFSKRFPAGEVRPQGAEESSPEHGQEPSSDKVFASFTLGGDQIKKLKELVSAKAAPPGGTAASFHCSSIMVAFAYVWVCLVSARGYDSERTCHFFFATNCRNGMHPPVPAEYFGNCVGCCLVEAKAGDLVGAEGFVTAAKCISKSIELFKKDALHGIDKLPETFARIIPGRPLSVAGSPHFKVYSFDFGWGRPEKVEVVSISETGAMSVAESREGGAGLELGFVLPRLEMDEFAAHFDGDYDRLFL